MDQHQQVAGFLLEIFSTPGAVNIDSSRAEQIVSAKQWLALIAKGEFNVQESNARLSPDAVIHGYHGNGQKPAEGNAYPDAGSGTGAGPDSGELPN